LNSSPKCIRPHLLTCLQSNRVIIFAGTPLT
jgi:hypothetical protein